MSTEILVNVTARETRIALVKTTILDEIYIERSNSQRLVGNIYKGKVVRVLPGMQAAFVDVGLARTGFLHQSDLSSQQKELDITQCLKVGQEILVQVIKEPVQTKGARLTTQLSIATPVLAYAEGVQGVNISQKITDEEERERLKSLLADDSAGYIIRTKAEFIDDLQTDKEYLDKLWDKIKINAKSNKAPAVVYKDLSICLRTLRDLLNKDTSRILVDDEDSFAEIKQFIAEFMPNFNGKVEYYTEMRPIFDIYGINDEIAKALERKVPLKNGGHLIIDHTEAMTTIDVNTGAYVGVKNFEETVFRTNLEAVAVIGRQLRLRSIGGIIIVDFIDMQVAEHKERILRELATVLEKDSVKTTVDGFTSLGLVEITRKRTRESLQQILCHSCPTCHGRGVVHTIETIVCDIFREIQRSIAIYAAGTVMIVAAPNIIKHLLEEERDLLYYLEEKYNKTIKYQEDPLYQQEQFDVVLL